MQFDMQTEAIGCKQGLALSSDGFAFVYRNRAECVSFMRDNSMAFYAFGSVNIYVI